MFKTVTGVMMLAVLAMADGPVLKTGQTTVYKAGDDGTYQAGIARSYSRANGVVTDNATGLQWQDDYSDNSGNVKQANWADAQTYCQALNLDGKTDWRLPSQKELRTLVDRSHSNPAIDPVFQKTASYVYWSSTTYAPDTSFAWGVTFGHGGGVAGNKTNSHYVRCVRGGQI
jgi:hypothetical protein